MHIKIKMLMERVAFAIAGIATGYWLLSAFLNEFGQ